MTPSGCRPTAWLLIRGARTLLSNAHEVRQECGPPPRYTREMKKLHDRLARRVHDDVWGPLEAKRARASVRCRSGTLSGS